MAGVEKNSRRACSLESRVTRLGEISPFGHFFTKACTKTTCTYLNFEKMLWKIIHFLSACGIRIILLKILKKKRPRYFYLRLDLDWFSKLSCRTAWHWTVQLFGTQFVFRLELNPSIYALFNWVGSCGLTQVCRCKVQVQVPVHKSFATKIVFRNTVHT
jgi:hypothetical protein